MPELQVRLLRPTQSLARLHFIFDGSQDWVIAYNDVVAGSSPASGTKCRSSSVVEHVNSQFVSYPSVLSAGRRLWVLVDPAIPVQIRSVACDGGATFSTPGNSTVAFLPVLPAERTGWVLLIRSRRFHLQIQPAVGKVERDQMTCKETEPDKPLNVCTSDRNFGKQ